MKQEMIAMLLAGGKGTRLESLTSKNAKPVVSFGGKYKIIDFPLSNCANSSIKVVGVLTQYESTFLNEYVGNGKKWGFDAHGSACVLLPPKQTDEGILWYDGTARAILRNIDFMDKFNPEYVLILSADHIYKMDYNKMLDFHKKNNADCTISVMKVPFEEASRFGILNINQDFSIYEFDEKPANPKSDLASMGIYIFKYQILKKYLLEASEEENDFGKHILPKMLNDNLKMFAYLFDGYWKDVGTIGSLWEANMELLEDLYDDFRFSNWPIYSNDYFLSPQLIKTNSNVKNSLVGSGSIINGQVINSIIFNNVIVEKDAIVKNSVVHSGSIIKKNSRIYKCIIEEDFIVEENKIYNKEAHKVVLISKNKEDENE